MPRKGHTNVSVPDALVDTIRAIIADPKTHYEGMGEFVREALREKLERIQLTRSKRPHSSV